MGLLNLLWAHMNMTHMWGLALVAIWLRLRLFQLLESAVCERNTAKKLSLCFSGGCGYSLDGSGYKLP